MFKQDDSMLRFGALAVDNLFFQEYLPAAKGDYVKVYLYGLYLSQHPREELSLAEVAHDLSLSEGEVEAALRYWERRRLVTRLRDNPPEYAFRSAAQLAVTGSDADVDPAFIAFSEVIYDQFDGRRKVRPNEIAQAWEWVQDIGLPQERVVELIAHLARTRGVNFSFALAEKEAVRMKEANVLTDEDAEAFFAHSRETEEGARAVLRRLGKRRAPSDPEMQLYRKWLGEWQYTQEAILEACAETTKGEPTFAYLDGILSGIRQRAAVHTGEELRSRLATEKDEQAAVRSFARALGVRSANELQRKTYQRMTASHDPDVVLLVAQEAHANQKGLDAVDDMLAGLQRRGVTTYADARAYFDEVHALNRALEPVFAACGLQNAPAPADRTLYKKWQGWGMSEELILLAAEQSRAAERKMPYMDKILTAWHEEGVTSPDQVKTRKKPAAGARRVSAQEYAQRDYTEEELESRVTDILEEARKLHE